MTAELLVLPLDTLGTWGESTVRMGSSLARHTGGEESEIIRHLVQRVSITLMKVNANLILNRSPNNNPTNIDRIEKASTFYQCDMKYPSLVQALNYNDTMFDDT